MTDRSENGAAAIEYAERGWLTFPLHSIQKNGTCSCGTRCSSPGKHPRTKNGFIDATTDPTQIDAWWSKWPDANIGVATGEQSGLWVLDIDSKHSVDIGGGTLMSEGEHSLRVLENEYDTVPPTLTQATGSGGRHLFFHYPAEGDHRNRTRIRDSLDVRAQGGYVVMPPSNHASGHHYIWHDETAPLANVPDWLASLDGVNTEGSRVSAILGGERVPIGARNRAMFELGSYYRGVHGFDYEQIKALLLGYNITNLDEPLSEKEIGDIAESAASQDVNEPDPVWVNQHDVEDDIDPGDDMAMSLHDLMQAELEPPTPIVDGLIDGGSGIIVAGPPNVGKSWWVLDLALSVATGTDFLHQFPTHKGGVLIVDEEGTEWGDQRRFDMLLEGRGIGSTAEIPIHLAIGKGYKLDTRKGLTAIRRMIERYKPNLVIIDSLIRVHQGDENVSRDMAQFFAISSQLMQTTGAAFVFVHHVRKIGVLDQGLDPGEFIRGSSEIRAWPSIAFVILPGEDNQVQVYNIKQRWRAKPDPFGVRIQVDSEGTSARLGYMGRIEKKNQSAASMGARIVELVSELHEQGKEPTAILIAGLLNKSTSTITDHMKRLVAAGALTQEPGTRIQGARGLPPMVYRPPVQPRTDDDDDEPARQLTII